MEWIIGLYMLFTTKSTKVKKDMIGLLIFSLMQFADAILWLYRHEKEYDKPYNNAISDTFTS